MIKSYHYIQCINRFEGTEPLSGQMHRSCQYAYFRLKSLASSCKEQHFDGTYCGRTSETLILKGLQNTIQVTMVDLICKKTLCCSQQSSGATLNEVSFRISVFSWMLLVFLDLCFLADLYKSECMRE